MDAMPPPPKYSGDPESKKVLPRRLCALGVLLFYAGVVTAALIVVSVLGALYIREIKTSPPMMDDRADSSHHTAFSREDGSSRADLSLDPEANREIMRFSGKDGNDTLIVMDFNTGIGGIWMADADECHVFDGLDGDIRDPRIDEELIQAFLQPDTIDGVVEYDALRDHTVTNLDLLPRELHALCWGKDVFWLRLKDRRSDGVVKRQTRCCDICCIMIFCGRENRVCPCPGIRRSGGGIP